MSGSADLYRRLKNRDIMIDGSDGLSGFSNVYITPGGTHECHPDFVATPIGTDPYGFLVCRRKIVNEPVKRAPFMKYHLTNSDTTVSKVQTYDLYSSDPNAQPRRTLLGGQPLELQDRRLPNQAHLQGVDYYRDPVLYRGIGIENLEKDIGQFGYRENKYFFSRPMAKFDINFAVQPFDLWKREQLRSGHFTKEEMNKIEKENGFVNSIGTF